MQNYFVAFLTLFIFIFNMSFAGTINPVTTRKFAVNDCNHASTFFKFHNDASGQYALYINAKEFNANSTLISFSPIPKGDSIIYKNTFDGNQAIVTGQALSVDEKTPDIQSLCGISSICECTKDGCNYEVQTIGVKCDIDGKGTEEAPYVFILK